MKIAAEEIFLSNTRLIFLSNVSAVSKGESHARREIYICATDAYVIPVNKMILKYGLQWTRDISNWSAHKII